MSGTWLSQAEVDELCEPLKQPAAQVKYLRDVLGLTVNTKPNGRALVVREHVARVLSGDVLVVASGAPAPTIAHTPAPQPNVDGFLKLVQGGKRNGSKAKVQSA